MGILDENIVNRKTSASAIKTIVAFSGVPGLGSLDITDSIADGGITWASRTVGGHRIGAGGHVTMYDLPEAYTCTINVPPDTPARLAFDLFIELTKPNQGVQILDAYITLTQENATTKKTEVYTFGIIEEEPSGSSYTRGDGQEDRAYTLTFKSKTVI